ncbi:hypothetical protein Glove_346g152 [Diversispora epigaea]|uniref:Uncharacterized protein n=1 Tax=Diversispora epigaea TaxID=1348612 RepID=A0A397HEW7_9GLOM|nr:hypothetical protein Glove_346g152 [Diversispora epigaea]
MKLIDSITEIEDPPMSGDDNNNKDNNNKIISNNLLIEQFDLTPPEKQSMSSKPSSNRPILLKKGLFSGSKLSKKKSKENSNSNLDNMYSVGVGRSSSVVKVVIWWNIVKIKCNEEYMKYTTQSIQIPGYLMQQIWALESLTCTKDFSWILIPFSVHLIGDSSQAKQLTSQAKLNPINLKVQVKPSWTELFKSMELMGLIEKLMTLVVYQFHWSQ